MRSDDTSPSTRTDRSSRRRRIVAAGTIVGLTASVAGALQSPAQAEGFFDSIRNALFGRIVEVRPSYAALPRETGREPSRRGGGFRDLRRDGFSDEGGYGYRGPREDRDGYGSRERHSTRDRRATPFREVRVGDGGGGGGRTMCVRLCDGYTFPIGRLRGDADLATHQAACSAACPGTQTALYRLGSGSSLASPAKASSTVDGSLYRQLATAFLFRKERVAQCSCQGPDNIATRLPIEQDDTLRKGDVVVAENGTATAFDGTEDGRKVFTDFQTSAALSKSARRQIDKTMGVSQRAAVARDFADRMASLNDGGPAVSVTSGAGRTREASLRAVAAPAGSGAGVRAFQVVSPAAGGEGIRSVGANVYVIR